MFTEQLQHIERLMAGGEWEAAEKALQELFAQPGFMDAFAGGTYVDMATCYLAAVKAAQQEYGDTLDAEMTILKSIDAREREVNEEIDLARLDGEIKRLQKEE